MHQTFEDAAMKLSRSVDRAIAEEVIEAFEESDDRYALIFVRYDRSMETEEIESGKFKAKFEVGHETAKVGELTHAVTGAMETGFTPKVFDREDIDLEELKEKLEEVEE